MSKRSPVLRTLTYLVFLIVQAAGIGLAGFYAWLFVCDGSMVNPLFCGLNWCVWIYSVWQLSDTIATIALMDLRNMDGRMFVIAVAIVAATVVGFGVLGLWITYWCSYADLLNFVAWIVFLGMSTGIGRIVATFDHNAKMARMRRMGPK